MVGFAEGFSEVFLAEGVEGFGGGGKVELEEFFLGELLVGGGLGWCRVEARRSG